MLSSANTFNLDTTKILSFSTVLNNHARRGFFFFFFFFKTMFIFAGRRPISGSLQSIPTSGLGSSGSPLRGPSPVPRPAPNTQTQPRAPPRSHSPVQRGVSPRRAESPMRKTGSSVDYTSTQWDSDDDEEESDIDEEPAFASRSGPRMVSQARLGSVPPNPSRPGLPTPQARPEQPQRQPSPAPRQQVKTVVSKPLQDFDDDDDWLDSERLDCNRFLFHAYVPHTKFSIVFNFRAKLA